jgi:hypothetical protein
MLFTPSKFGAHFLVIQCVFGTRNLAFDRIRKSENFETFPKSMIYVFNQKLNPNARHSAQRNCLKIILKT